MTSIDTMYGAIARGDVDTVRQLIASDPSIVESCVINKSWLHWAAQDGNTQIMEVLVESGIPIDKLTSDGNSTPLEIAAGLGQYGACKWLIDHNANLNNGLGETATPIFSAIYSRSLELVRLFVERGADLNATFGAPTVNVIGFAEAHGTPEIVNFLQGSRARR